MYEKVLGGLLGAAVGDAMGAATEIRSMDQIKEAFGGRVIEFKTPPNDTLAKGRMAGQITDAFSIPYILIQHLIKAQGKASTELAQRALIEWGSHKEWFEPFAGMTTRKAVNTLMEQEGNVSYWSFAGHLGNKLFKGHYYALSSNGAATKAFPMGLLHPGDLDKAIEETILVTMSSHDDEYSISGACAIAAAISKAMEQGVSVYDIIQGAMYGAKVGEEKGHDIALHYPGPSVQKRIDMAVNIAMKEGTPEDTMVKLAELIGSGPAISETVPTALGIFIANNGKTIPSIYDGVNIGDETSAIASIVGALGGAYNGVTSITSGYEKIIKDKNNMDLEAMAKDICKNIHY